MSELSQTEKAELQQCWNYLSGALSVAVPENDPVADVHRKLDELLAKVCDKKRVELEE